MSELIIEKIQRVSQNRERLERELDVKISTEENKVFIDGKAEDEYVAGMVVEALDFNFPFQIALLIKKEDFVFEKLNIKDFTKRNDLSKVRARIIGKNGKVLKTLCDLTNCFFELNGNYLGIIGPAEEIKNVQNSCVSIIAGAKHANVYKFLEKHKPVEIEDFGLKEENKKNLSGSF